MTAAAAPSSTQALRPAVHGDSWTSPWWFLHTGGAPIEDLEDWTVRATARASRSDEPLFTWTTPGGGVLLGAATARIPATDARVKLTGLRLRLRPQDWTDQPPRWSGLLEVELTHGPLSAPIARRTVVRRRFQITPDLVP